MFISVKIVNIFSISKVRTTNKTPLGKSDGLPIYLDISYYNTNEKLNLIMYKVILNVMSQYFLKEKGRLRKISKPLKSGAKTSERKWGGG